MTHREQVTRTVAIALVMVFVFILLLIGAFWLRAQFQAQAAQQVHHALRLVCCRNTLYC